MIKQDNYKIQMEQAKKLFLTYDQQELIRRCRLRFDESYFYVTMLARNYRIHRQTGDMQYLREAVWEDGNSFHELMTMLDWLCDSKPARYITGRWINIVTHGHYFHRQLQEDEDDTNASLFSSNPEAFASACEAMGAEKMPGADIGYAIELVDGLRIFVQLWHGDDEFKPRLRWLWDENTLSYIRYETTWFAVGLLMRRIKEEMKRSAAQ